MTGRDLARLVTACGCAVAPGVVTAWILLRVVFP